MKEWMKGNLKRLCKNNAIRSREITKEGNESEGEKRDKFPEEIRRRSRRRGGALRLT